MTKKTKHRDRGEKMKKITNQSNCENTASHERWVKVRQDSRISIKISFRDHDLLKMLLLARYCQQVVNG